MRLRLNTTLRAALIAAITAVGFTLTQAQASTEYNGVTYSGYIYNVMNTGNQTFHNATFTNYYRNGETWENSQQWAGDGSTYYTGTESHSLTGSNNSFWRRNFGDANSGDAKLLGNTIRLASAKSNAYYESTFGPYQIGGIIAEAGNDGMYVLGRTGGSCEMRLKAQEGSDFNMYVASNLGLSSNTSITVYNNGKWNVLAGKTLTLAKYTNTGNVGSIANTPSITFNGRLHVDMIGGGTIDLTHTNALTVGEGTTISVGADTKLLLASNTTLGGTITNAGTVTFAGGIVTLTNSLSGFESSGKYVNWQDQEAENGYAGTMDYTIIKGTSSLTQVIWRGETKDLTNGVLHVDREVDKTTYHMNKSGATLDLAEEIGHNSALTTVEVKGETGTITVNSNSTLGSLSIASGSTATVNGTAELTLNGLTGAGNLIAGANSNVSVNALTSYTGTMSVADGGTLNLGGNIVLANLTIEHGTVTTAHAGSSGVITDTLTIGEDGTFKVIGAHDAFGYDGGATKKIDMRGTEGHLARLVLEQNTNNSVTMTTDIAMHGYSAITSKEGGKGFNTYGTAITVEGVQNSIEIMDLRKPSTITVAKDSDLSIGKVTLGGDNAKTVTKAGEGTLTLTGSAVMEGLTISGGQVVSSGSTTLHALTITTDGSLTVASGTTAVSGDSNVISKTINIGATGILNLAGTYNVSGIAADGVTSYEGSEVLGTDNGFKKTSGKVQVLSVTEGGQFSQESATINYNGSVYELDATGAFELPGTADYSTLFVNTGTVSFSAAKGIATEAGKAVSFVEIAADTTLKVDDDIALSMITGTSTGTLDIAADKTVTAGDATTSTKLAGEGTIVLKSGATNLAGATMTKDWAGTAKVTGTINNIDLNNYGQDGSKVELDGVNGYFLQAQKEFAPELVLGENGLTINNGYSTLASGDPKPPTKYTFAGGVSGEGVMDFNKTTAGVVTQHLYFTGDVSDWDGELKVTNNFTVYAQYSGEDQVVNSSIHRTGGTLNVEVGTGSAADVVTFHRDITADSFTVMQGATANVYDNLTATTIAVAEDATLNMDGGTLSTAITNNGTVSLTDITLNADGFEEQGGDTAYFDLTGVKVEETDNHYLGADETYVQVVNGGTVSGSGISWKDGTYDLKDDGRIVVNQGGADYGTFFVVTEAATSEIVAASHYDELNTIVVSDWAALNVDADVSGKSIEVKEGGFISGSAMTPESVSMDAQAVAVFNNDVTTANGIVFSDQLVVSMTNTNEDGSPVQYSTGEKAIAVTADKMEMTGNTDVTVSNQLVVDEIVNTTTKVLTLDNVKDTLALVNMDITGSTAEVGYITGEEPVFTEATVSISGVLQGGEATLLANLTLKGGSKLDVDGGADKALTLGSTLSFDFTEGGLVNLDEDTIAALNKLTDGQKLDLIVAAEGTQLDYSGAQTGMSYDQLFSADGLTGIYTVYADGSAFGLTKSTSPIPEPTTGTLSLLALAALAARRRRK